MKADKKISFIINGKIRKMKSLRESIIRVFGNSFYVEIRKSTLRNNFRTLVTKAVRNGSCYIILVGGDGSVNEGVNGYFDVGDTERENVILGVLPAGSGNDFSRSLGVENDVEQLHALIKSDSITKIDVGLMHYTGLKSNKESRYFINITDIGIGGFVAKKIALSKKRMGGDFTYTKAIIQSFVQYKKQEITLTSENYNWSGKMMSICMANGKYFGSGMCIAPDANLIDGRMQLVIIGDVKLSDYLKNIPKIKKGVKIAHKEVIYTSAKACEITSKAPCPIDMDGEYIGSTPLQVEILQQVVPMLM